MIRNNPEPASGIAAAAEWRLLGLLLERPRDTWLRDVASLAAEVQDPKLRAAAAAARDATEGVYLSLLGPGGAASPREVSCRSFEDPGKILADLRGFFDAFGFRPLAEDPLDHVAVETAFVSYLLLKEEFARARGEGAAGEITAAARQQFIETHLAPLAAAFAERLSACGSGYLAEAARLLAERVPQVVPPAIIDADAAGLSGCGGCSLRGALDA